MARPELETGIFGNTMAYGRMGDGSKNALLIPGGPGNTIQEGLGLRLSFGQLRRLVDSDFTVWQVTRTRGMPQGHSVADMADDYADLIANEFDGRVDLVVGVSYGGIIAQYLAADHPETFGHVVVVVAACQVSEPGKEIDFEFAQLMSEGEATLAGTVMVESLFPGLKPRFLAKLGGWFLGRMARGEHETYQSDILVEGEAEVAFDSRGVLPCVSVPVLMICGGEDHYFSMEHVEETAELIPDCTLIVYEGKGHMGAASDKRVVPDVLRFVGQP